MVVLFCAGACVVVAQQASDDDVFEVGPGISAPRLTGKTEPIYTPAASKAAIHGDVLLQLVIDETGVPQGVEVLRPLGYGLDESAMQAVASWRFSPGKKGRRPVKIRATIDVAFHPGSGESVDSIVDERRKQFNVIMGRLAQDAAARPTQEDLKTMQELASRNLPSALFVLGTWQTYGFGMPKDPPAGLVNIQKAADENEGPAIYYLGKKMLSEDRQQGLLRISQAADLGSTEAQVMLGALYEDGNGVDVDLEKARHYLRWCATAAVPKCELRLGKLLIDEPQRKQMDWMQGVAWLKLAAEHGEQAAKDLADVEAAKLTPQQRPWVEGLAKQLERKR